MIEPWDSAWLQEAPSRLGEMTFQCSGGDRSGRETLSLAVDSVRIKTEGDGDRCAQKPPGALSWTWVLTASPVSLHLGPTGVCGFGGPYGETVATGAYRAFRVATAAGHCGAFSGTDGSRTSKSQGGNYAMPPPRASARQQLPHSSGSSSSSTVLTLVPHPFHEAPALAFVSVPLPAPVCPQVSAVALLWPISVFQQGHHMSIHSLSVHLTSCDRMGCPVKPSDVFFLFYFLTAPSW